MMNRRILLPLGVFIAILAVVLVYWKVAGGTREIEHKTSLEYNEPSDTNNAKPEGEVDVSGGKGIDYSHWDEHGNLVARCQAKSWDKQSRTVFRMDYPVVTFYMKDGRTISLRGNNAVVHGEEISKSVKVNKGNIEGDVLLTVDMANGPTTIPLEQRPEDKLEIYLESAEFDNDLLQIESDGPVTVLSKNVDLYGQGLSLTWNQSPSELRLLKIMQGEKVIVRAMPEGLDESEPQEQQNGKNGTADTDSSVKTPTGGNDASGGSDESEKPAELPEWTPPGPDEYADDILQDSAATQLATALETRPATNPAATEPTTKPATGPATRSDIEIVKPKRRNILQADFIDKVHGVHVDQGPNHLRGAEKLSIIFRMSEQDSSRRRPKPRPTTEPTSRPDEVSSSQPTTAPETQPEENGPDAPMIITWQGPLEIRSIGHDENPDSKRVVVIADGRELKFSTADTLTTCQRMIFRNPEQTGRLVGTAGRPVQLSSAGGQKIITEGVRFERAMNIVYLDGQGYMEDVSSGAATQPSSQPATAPDKSDEKSKSGVTVKWSKGAIARIRESRAKQPDGADRTNMFLEEARISGDVEMTRSDSGDIVNSREMHLFMDEYDGQGYPTKVIAIGDVNVSQADSDTMADKVTVYFAEPVPDEMKDKTWRSPRVEKMTAKGNVRFYSKREDQAATLKSGERRPNMTGEDVTLYFVEPAPGDEKEENDKTGRRMPKVAKMTADGKGSLFFRTTSQPNGEKLEKPRDVSIAWSEQMDYTVADLEAVFKGDVRLDTDGQHIEGREMAVKFEKDETAAASKASKEAADDGEKKKSGGVDMDQFVAMRVVSVTTSGDVKVESALTDEQDNLLRRVNLKTETGSLTYDVKAGQMTVTGPGTFAAEDYRAPKLQKVTGSKNELQRPSQTYLKWAKIMRFTQTKGEDGKFDGGGEVIAREDVEMVFASGKYLVKQDKVKHVDWGELKEGRVTTLGCDDLWAKFDKPEEDAATTRPASGPEDMTLGRLKEFKAMGRVLASDGVEIKRKITADTLHYTSDDQLLRILGTKEKPATLTETNSITGTVRPMKSSRILWYRANDNFIVEDTKVGG